MKTFSGDSFFVAFLFFVWSVVGGGSYGSFKGQKTALTENDKVTISASCFLANHF